MKKVFAILRLVRWVNLLIIALSMYLFQYCVIRVYMNAADMDPTMNWTYFSLLVLSTVLIAAGGNVVNAYMDFEQDAIYKRNKLILGESITLNTGFYLQMVLSVTGVLIGFFLSYHFGNIRLGYIFLSATALLWLYSLVLKKYFLIGNIVVALLSAVVFALPVLFEHHLFDFFQSDHLVIAKGIIIAELKMYMLFAFTVSLIREIVKDAEDREGDEVYNMKTLSVVWPIWAINLVVILLMIGMMVVIGFVQRHFWMHGLKKHFWFALFFLQFPILTNMMTVTVSKRRQDYHNISVLLKLLMFFGIASLPAFYLFITKWQ